MGDGDTRANPRAAQALPFEELLVNGVSIGTGNIPRVIEKRREIFQHPFFAHPVNVAVGVVRGKKVGDIHGCGLVTPLFFLVFN